MNDSGILLSVTQPPVTETKTTEVKKVTGNEVDPRTSGEQRKAHNAALFDLTAEEVSENYFLSFAEACRTYLPHITVESYRQKARDLVAELTRDRKAAA
jgi:hypothetical protein